MGIDMVPPIFNLANWPSLEQMTPLPANYDDTPIPLRPVDEQPKPAPKPKRKPKPAQPKPSTRLVTPTPGVVGDGRGMGVVNMPQPKEELPRWAWPIPNVPKTTVRPEVRPKWYGTVTNTERTPTLTPRKESWLSSQLRPPQDELDAANNGMRWHWALEHRFMPPGSQWNNTVWNGVDRENSWLMNLLKDKAITEKGLMTPVARERQRSTMQNMWKTFLTDIKNGHFDNYGGTTQSALDYADAFRKHYTDTFGEDAISELAPMPDVLGKRSDLGRKSLIDARQLVNDTSYFSKQLDDWIKSGAFKDEQQARMISVQLDKIAQSQIAKLGGDSAALADAEKKRIQMTMLPEEYRKQVEQTFKNYQEFLRKTMQVAGSSEWDQNTQGKVDKLFKTLDSDAGLAQTIATVGGIVTSLLGDTNDLPQNLAVDLAAAQQKFDTYMDQIMYAANVSPQVTYEFAKYLHDRALQFYNNELGYYRRQNAGDALVDDFVEQQFTEGLDKLIQNDGLLAPLTFPAPVYNRKAKGGKTAGNAGSEGRATIGTPEWKPKTKFTVIGF